MVSLSFYFCASAAAICAIYYGFELSHQKVSVHRSVIKTASTAILMVASFILGAPWLLVLLLATAATGDFLISLRHEKGFVASLGPFAVVRLIAIALFVQHTMGVQTLFDDPWRVSLLTFLISLTLWVCWKMWPDLGSQKWPVSAYTAIAAAMGAVALTLPTTAPIYFGQVAAGLLILSDALIGLTLFGSSLDSPRFHRLSIVTWFSYFGALVCLLAAFT